MSSSDLQRDLERARSGDRAALHQVLEKIQPRLRVAAEGRLSRLLRQRLGTSDILQTTYLDVVRSIGEFKGADEDTFVAWVTRILENNIRDKARFYDRARRRAPEGAADSGPPEDAESHDPSPSRRAMQVENLLLVGRALDGLTDLQRRVLIHRMVDGQEYDEIARAVDRSEGAVRMLVSRARAALALEMDRLLDEE